MKKIHFFSDTEGVRQNYPQFVFAGVLRNSCKSMSYVYEDTSKPKRIIIAQAPVPHQEKPIPHPFITIHGNISYDMYYQSDIDTPYIGKNLDQQTISTHLDVKLKDDYPLRISFTTRFSNSSLFQNFTGLNLGFNNQDFKNEIIQRLRNWAMQQAAAGNPLNKYKALILAKINQAEALRNWLNSPSVLQQLVEQKEQALAKRLYGGQAATAPAALAPPTSSEIETALEGFGEKKLYRIEKADSASRNDSTARKADSSVAKFQKEYAAKQAQLDSVEKQEHHLDSLYQKVKSTYSQTTGSTFSALGQVHNNKDLLGAIVNSKAPDSILPKGYKTLLAVKSIGIGRTTLNYSELTVKNISITGFQIELNPSYYFAVATGGVDYVFRDFVLNNAYTPKQYVSVVRVGKGMKDGNNIIFTYYFGKKQLYDYTVYDSSNRSVTLPDYNLVGYSLQGNYKVGKHTTLTAEAAKSSLPYYNRMIEKEGILQSAVSFKDRTNEGYSVKLQSFFPKTKTKLTGYYNKLGANFQSFSLYTTGSALQAWSVGATQPFWKDKLTVSGSVKTNDYTNPYLSQYQSNIVFKSIQATLRLHKLPVFSMGYYPSEELIKLSDSSFTENLFYTLVATMSYSYRLRGINMNTYLTFTRFYNRPTDTGFVYFNTKNISLSHSMIVNSFTIRCTLSAATNTQYDLFSEGGNLQYKVKKWLSLGGGCTYNQQTVFDDRQLGYSVNTAMKISKLGQLQLLWSKAFIPGINKQLVENNTGRITFSKIF